MKIVGKLGHNYMLTANLNEILLLVFGCENADYNDRLRKEVEAFKNSLEKGETQLSVHQKFYNVIKIANTKLDDGWNAVAVQLKTLQDLIKPVQAWIDEVKKEVENNA